MVFFGHRPPLGARNGGGGSERGAVSGSHSCIPFQKFIQPLAENVLSFFGSEGVAIKRKLEAADLGAVESNDFRMAATDGIAVGEVAVQVELREEAVGIHFHEERFNVDVHEVVVHPVEPAADAGFAYRSDAADFQNTIFGKRSQHFFSLPLFDRLVEFHYQPAQMIRAYVDRHTVRFLKPLTANDFRFCLNSSPGRVIGNQFKNIAENSK